VRQLQPHANPRPLGRFHGGIHIPGEKALSNRAPVTAAPLPKLLTIPLQQHIGGPARPLVQIGQRVLKGERIAEPRAYVSAAIHASSSGTVVAIEKRPIPHPSGLDGPCIVIETDGADEWAPLPEPLTDYASRDPALVRERIRWAGIVGMGGAAFPTSVKLNPGPDKPIRTLIINGAECEPYITCDDMLMRERGGQIIQGARIILHLLGARVCLIGIEDNKPEAIEAMRLAVAQSDIKDLTKVVAIPTLYPSGGEKQLIKILTGKEVPSHGIPAQIGIMCQNVGTALAVAGAVLAGRPLISRYVTVTGRGIRSPRNLETRIGTSAAELIAHCGGYAHPIRKLVLGGPMMGFTLDAEDVPITKAANCVLALTAEESPDPGQPLPCIRCGNCAAVCPMSLLPQQLYWHARAQDLDKVQDYKLFDCIECGCCAHVCPSHIPLVQYYRYAKTASWAREQEKRKAEHVRERHAAREARLARQEAERQAKLREKKEALEDKPVAAGRDGAEDPKKAAIEAARKRAAAKKAALAERAMGAASSAPAERGEPTQVPARRPAAETQPEAASEE
jgi:electron transport complex protein RnfC